MANWEANPPQIYDIVTGYFPETSPKETWATNPRPLLVCGVAHDKSAGIYFCRIAYGTTKNVNDPYDGDLVIGNLSLLNQLNLKSPTKFVLNSGSQMVIMPWTSEFFQPWTGYTTPAISRLLPDMQRHVGHDLCALKDLPKF